MSFCIYTVLFTLSDKEPSKNEYVKIFQIWLSQLIKTNAAEKCVIIIDNRTFDFLAESYILNKFTIRRAKFAIQFIKVDPPKTLLEGMAHKYTIFSYKEEYLMYCDIDIMINKTLKKLNLPKYDCIFAHAEGLLKENGYSDAFSEKAKLEFDGNEVGFSAGKFIIRGSGLRDRLFQNIQHLIKTDSIENPLIQYYSVEQPYFNKALYELITEIPVNYFEIVHPKISNNCRDFIESEAVLIDFQGQPGEGGFHLDKIIDFIAYSNST